MKHCLPLLTLWLLLASLSTALAAGSADGHLATPGASFDSAYKIENLSADIYLGGTILLVKGEVRNLKPTPVSGNVIVHLQTENREEIGTVESELYKTSTIQPGASGQLEVVINIAKFPKIKNVSIEFVSR